jgi:hypothetical protein
MKGRHMREDRSLIQWLQSLAPLVRRSIEAILESVDFGDREFHIDDYVRISHDTAFGKVPAGSIGVVTAVDPAGVSYHAQHGRIVEVTWDMSESALTAGDLISARYLEQYHIEADEPLQSLKTYERPRDLTLVAF